MRSISLKLFLPIVSFLLLAHCKKDEDPLNPNAPIVLKNIAYGSHPQQVMDIYLPAGRSTTTTKVAVLVHGGGWNGGDKSDFDQYVDSLKRREPTYAIININYRLTSGTTILLPSLEQDVLSAMQFIASNAGKYNYSNKMVLIGASSGGHLALLQAYKNNLPAVKAVIDFFGPTDLIWMYNNPTNQYVPVLLEQVTGGTPTTQQLMYLITSPLNYVTAQSPPTLIFQGGQDPLVSPTLSTMLRDKLQSVGVVNQYIFYPNEAHGWVGATMTDSFDRIAAFLATHVQ